MDGIVEAPHLGPETSDADLAPLAAIIGDAPFVGLGESLHCAGGYLEAKARIVRWLVETQGFRLITIESPWVWGEAATRYVDSGEGTAKEAMASFFGAFHDRETEAMLAWLTGWNVEHPDDPVHFVGFDVQDKIETLVAKLESLDVDHDLAASCGVGPCEVTSADPWVDLVVHTLDARRELDHYPYADPSYPFVVRDRGMADTLLAIRDLVAPEAKTVVLAHNVHLERHGSAYSTTNMGEHLGAWLGADWAPLGFVSPEVESACQGNAWHHSREDVEHAIERRVTSPAAFVDLADATWLEDRMWSLGGRGLVRPFDQFRGLVWLDHVRGAVDTASYAGTPVAEADAVKDWGNYRIFSHETENTRTEQERLWSSYASWIAGEGYVARTKRHHAPWNKVKWQTFEKEEGSRKLALEVRRPGPNDRWDVWMKTWESRHAEDEADSMR